MERVVTRAVCASISKFEGSAMHELLAIRNQLCAPGRKFRTRVSMLYASRWFVLWVEGDDDAVDKVLAIAAADKRVAHHRLLHRSRGPAHLPERINVSTTQSPLRPTQYARLVAQLVERGSTMEPVEICRLLGAPCAIAPHGDLLTRPVRQVALLSAEDNGPIDQLRKLGERFRTPVIYRRFGAARSHTPDVGASYLDMPLLEGIGRIHLLPRRALEQSMAKRALVRFEAIALLLGTNAAAAVSVASGLADCLQGHSPQPAVYVSGTVEEGSRACARLLETRGIARIALADPQGTQHDIEALLSGFGWRTRGKSVGATPGHAPGVSRPLPGWAQLRSVPTI